MKKQGLLIILSGPSGSGKGTIVEQLAEDEQYSLSISATTRAPRVYETPGVHYFFYTKEQFQEMEKNERFLEWAEFCGNYYGTPKDYVLEQMQQGQHVILEIEVQGALKVKKIFPQALLLFVLPPSLEELKRRLIGRGTEDEQTIQKRLDRALEEIEFSQKYDYVVLNDTVYQAIEDIKTIVKAEQMRSERNQKIIESFKGEK